MKREITSLYQFFEAFPDEQSAIDHLRAIRWRDGAYCPYCQSRRVMHFSDRRTHKCHDCRQRFSIKVGTIFEDTKLPLRKWFAAIWLITSHKKGIASTALAKDLKITQKSAWFVLHRLRHAAKTKSFNRPLAGVVEADETLFGGKEKNKHKNKRAEKKGPIKDKAIVFGLLERGGELRVSKVRNLSKQTAIKFVTENLSPDATLMTDEWPGYNGLPEGHETPFCQPQGRRVRPPLRHSHQLNRRRLEPVQAPSLRHSSPHFWQAPFRVPRRDVLQVQPP